MSYERYDHVMLAMSFQRLQVWQRSMLLVKAIYDVTKAFPQAEVYGLTSQMRRCAVSIPSNIAEGSQRTSDRDFSNFILIARGSLAELLTQMLIASDLQYLNDMKAKRLVSECNELSKMLHSFYSKLTAHSS